MKVILTTALATGVLLAVGIAKCRRESAGDAGWPGKNETRSDDAA